MSKPRLPGGFIELPAGGCVEAGASFGLSGWALDSAAPLRAVLLIVDGRLVHVPQTGCERNDVGALFPEVPHAAQTGWEMALDSRCVQGGSIALSLVGLAQDGRWLELSKAAIRVASGATTGRRKRAVFTIVQNEPVFLPLWLRYYGRFFDPSDIYVLDHDSTDGSTSGLAGRCAVVPVHRTLSFDHTWLRDTAGSFQRFLLNSYDTVLFTEADEIIAPDPARYRDLGDYIERLAAPAACCTGHGVIQAQDEPALDFDRPILAQRRFWHRAVSFDKRLLSRAPLSWGHGFHEEFSFPEILPDPDLHLVHLHRVDFEKCVAKHAETARRDWNEEDVRRGRGRHNRIASPDELRQWFYKGADVSEQPAEMIPGCLRGLF
jgi:hypothetical protein